MSRWKRSFEKFRVYFKSGIKVKYIKLYLMRGIV